MADATWFEIDGDPESYPNIESVRAAAQQAAKSTDSAIDIYQCTRTKVRTVKRSMTISETVVSA
jgi:hypothetical protein